MAVSQTVLFTVMPRGISVDGATLPVSVMVSPRLMGANELGSFPDWVNWVARLKDRGLVLTFRNGVRTADIPIDTKVLQPDLWTSLFNEHTLVRSRKFDDYSDHGIISFSMRESLSALKTVYQEASVVLALPDAREKGMERIGNRSKLRDLTQGFDVHWNGDRAKSWRKMVRRMNATTDNAHRALNGPLDGEGLIVTARDASAFHAVAVPFAVYHNMPTPDRKDAGDVKVDPNAFDFHQAISSLGAHPELLRALGLVFDVELPADFVAQTTTGFDRLAVAKNNLDWKIPTDSPALDTAYVYFTAGSHKYFLTASRSMTDHGSPAQVFGLLNLDAQRFGLAQVDVDGGMHKTIMLAEIWNNPDAQRNRDPNVTPEAAPHGDIYDPDATVPSLRSGGLQLFADGRGLHVLDSIQQSKVFNDALESGGAQPRPFFAEDLVKGYRLDVWDSVTKSWHSLHLRKGDYQIGERKLAFHTKREEGFQQLAATQPAPGAKPADKDLYIHEAIARWAGWSLSVQMPGKALSRYGDPDQAVPPDGDDPKFRTDEALTPYKVSASYSVLPGTLPRLRFGSRYRVRARSVDLAGNSMGLDEPLADLLSIPFALPADPEGFTYLRFEPVAAPLVVIRDAKAVTLPGSAVDRVVIRTFNDDVSKDAAPADLTASDRHIIPPRTSVEMGERLGMFDDAAGKLKSDAATWKDAADRDAAELPAVSINVAGKTDNYPLVAADALATLSYLPDVLSRGAAIRDLPGSTPASIGQVGAGAVAAEPIAYEPLGDPNPRPGSATLISFETTDDWKDEAGFRFVLSEPGVGQVDVRPQWDAASRVLTAFLPKGHTAVVPLSSFVSHEDLKLMGMWQWMREYVERITIFGARPESLISGSPVDLIAHVLQRTVEGGHWMLTPPRLLTLVHAVQQPIGRPQFDALQVDHDDRIMYEAQALQTSRVRGRKDPEELGPVTAWRHLNATDAYLLGALKIHGGSTAKIDLSAEWSDPVDDPGANKPDVAHSRAHVDELPLSSAVEGYLRAPGKETRYVGYYDPENDQVAMVRSGDHTAKAAKFEVQFVDAAPRHLFNDTKHHRVSYTATASSRYREYFPQDKDLDFTRTGDAVLVDVPASARPLAPDVVYVLPTFGWQRQTETNLKRSVRFGGGLRVYLNRPWFSSGEGELLGVTLWSSANGPLDNDKREKFKPYFTQWGMDPIWQTAGLSSAPSIFDFTDAIESDSNVSLEETKPVLVDVVGFEPQFDEARGLWYADLTIDAGKTYAPFVRLALVRYQPHALDDARISRVVLAGFAQLTPDRAATVTADPHHPRSIRVVVSGLAPRGPQPEGPGKLKSARPTHIRVRVQEKTNAASDLSWNDVSDATAKATQFYEGAGLNQPEMSLWIGNVNFATRPAPGQYRLLIEEFEMISAEYTDQDHMPGRLIYAEAFAVDEALVSE